MKLLCVRDLTYQNKVHQPVFSNIMYQIHCEKITLYVSGGIHIA